MKEIYFLIAQFTVVCANTFIEELKKKYETTIEESVKVFYDELNKLTK